LASLEVERISDDDEQEAGGDGEATSEFQAENVEFELVVIARQNSFNRQHSEQVS